MEHTSPAIGICIRLCKNTLKIFISGLDNRPIIYSKKTYTFMLIQHIVINTFMWNFEEQNFSKFGVLMFLLLDLGVTMYLAGKITSLYKPVENFLLHKS